MNKNLFKKYGDQKNIMEFCPECDGILLPKKGSNELYCKVCDKSFKLDSKNKSNLKKEYLIKTQVKNRVGGKTAILEKKNLSKAISDEDRRAFEDFFLPDGQQQ